MPQITDTHPTPPSLPGGDVPAGVPAGGDALGRGRVPPPPRQRDATNKEINGEVQIELIKQCNALSGLSIFSVL